jgi:hypothetical protein
MKFQIGNRWPWSVRHPWQSWRERYVKNQSFFDPMIAKWQKKHGIVGEPQDAQKVSQKRKAPAEVVSKIEKKPKIVNQSTELPASHEPHEKGDQNGPPNRKESKATHENNLVRSESVASNDYTGEIFDDDTEEEEEEKETGVNNMEAEEEEEEERGDENEIVDELAHDDGDDNHDHDVDVEQQAEERMNHDDT